MNGTAKLAPVLVSVEDAATALGVRRTTAWELVRSGALRSTRIGARRLVPVAAIHEYAERLAGAEA